MSPLEGTQLTSALSSAPGVLYHSCSSTLLWSEGQSCTAALTFRGLGMPASSIGTALAFNGVWAVTCQLLFLKRIRHRFGVILSYQLLNAGWILAWPFVPLLHKVVLATESPQADGKYSNQRGRWLWLALAAQLGLTTIIGMASSLQMVIVNTAAPDRNSLGAVNGLSTSVGVSLF